MGLQLRAGGFADESSVSGGVDFLGFLSTFRSVNMAGLGLYWERLFAEDIARFEIEDFEVREGGFQAFVLPALEDDAADSVGSIF